MSDQYRNPVLPHHPETSVVFAVGRAAIPAGRTPEGGWDPNASDFSPNDGLTKPRTEGEVPPQDVMTSPLPSAPAGTTEATAPPRPPLTYDEVMSLPPVAPGNLPMEGVKVGGTLPVTRSGTGEVETWLVVRTADLHGRPVVIVKSPINPNLLKVIPLRQTEEARANSAPHPGLTDAAPASARPEVSDVGPELRVSERRDRFAASFHDLLHARLPDDPPLLGNENRRLVGMQEAIGLIISTLDSGVALAEGLTPRRGVADAAALNADLEDIKRVFTTNLQSSGIEISVDGQQRAPDLSVLTALYCRAIELEKNPERLAEHIRSGRWVSSYLNLAFQRDLQRVTQN